MRLYATLSDNTLEAVLELISLIANKQCFFFLLSQPHACTFQAATKQRIEKNVGPANEKNASTSFQEFFFFFFASLHAAQLYGERTITAEAVVGGRKKSHLFEFHHPCTSGVNFSSSNNNTFVGLCVTSHDSIKNR